MGIPKSHDLNTSITSAPFAELDRRGSVVFERAGGGLLKRGAYGHEDGQRLADAGRILLLMACETLRAT